jgi:hypothetical protein
VAAIVYWWLCTAGNWTIFAPEAPYGDVYDQLAISMKHGRLDLPLTVLGGEAYFVNNKYYGYWGPFPAVLRVPLALFSERGWVGHTARLSCWMAAMLTLMAILQIFRELEAITGWSPRARWFLHFTLAGYAFGTTVPFLLGRTFVYHEAILWAAALAHLCLWAGVRHVRTASTGALCGAIAAAGASALTRASVGYGAMAGVFLLITFRLWQLRRQPAGGPRRRSLAMLTGLGAFATVLSLLPFSYNYVLFGTVSRMPYERYLDATPERIAISDNGRMFKLTNVWPGFLTYFNPTHIRIERTPPYFHLTEYTAYRTGHRIEHSEPYASISSVMTGLLLLALIGACVGFQYPALLLPAAGGLAGVVAVCSYTAISHRYEHDFSPLVFLLGALGAVWLAARKESLFQWVRAMIAGLIVLGIVQAFALNYSLNPGSFKNFPQKLSVDLRHLFGLPLKPFAVRSWAGLPSAYRGQVFVADDPPCVIRFDGTHWEILSGNCPQIQHFRLRLTPAARQFTSSLGEPLVVNGLPDQGSFVFLQALEDGSLRVGVDIWAQPGLWGEPFRPAQPSFEMAIEIDALIGRFHATVDHRPVLDISRKPFLLDLAPPMIGSNPIGGTSCSRHFNGQIEVLEAPSNAILPDGTTAFRKPASP